MHDFRNIRSAMAAASVLAILLGLQPALPAAAVEEFHAYLTPSLPDTLHASLGSTAELRFWVDSSARRFNAYDVSIEYDPSIIEVESIQEGMLFTNACPDRFTQTTLGDGTAGFTHVLLCAGVSVDGPGTLCIFTIEPQSAGITHVTIVSDPDRTFYDAGYYVWPQHPDYPRQVVFHNAVVKVTDPTVSVDGHAGDRLADHLPILEIRPNPVRESAHLHFRLPEPGGVEIQIVDPAGRLLWNWRDPHAGAGWTSVIWDRRDSMNRTSAAGVYYCRILTGGHSVTSKLLVLP